MRACLGKDLRAFAPGLKHSLRPAFGGDVDDEERRIDHAGEADGAVDRFDLSRRRAAWRVVFGGSAAPRQQLCSCPRDHVPIFGVHHRDRTVFLGDGEDVEELFIIKRDVVGHEDLERGDAPLKCFWKLGQSFLRRVRDDQVVTPVEIGFRRRPAVISVERL